MEDGEDDDARSKKDKKRSQAEHETHTFVVQRKKPLGKLAQDVEMTLQTDCYSNDDDEMRRSSREKSSL